MIDSVLSILQTQLNDIFIDYIVHNLTMNSDTACIPQSMLIIIQHTVAAVC